jgi:hypothetical protein
MQGRIQDFKLGGGAHLKKLREIFWGISCEKSRFYAKKIIFLPILGGYSPLDPPLQCIYHNTKTENAKKKNSID